MGQWKDGKEGRKKSNLTQYERIKADPVAFAKLRASQRAAKRKKMQDPEFRKKRRLKDNEFRQKRKREGGDGYEIHLLYQRIYYHRCRKVPKDQRPPPPTKDEVREQYYRERDRRGSRDRVIALARAGGHGPGAAHPAAMAIADPPPAPARTRSAGQDGATGHPTHPHGSAPADPEAALAAALDRTAFRHREKTGRA